MLWLIFAMLLMVGVVSFFASYTMLGGALQIVLISALGGAWGQAHSRSIEPHSALSGGLAI
jgi:hypothetical protein